MFPRAGTKDVNKRSDKRSLTTAQSLRGDHGERRLRYTDNMSTQATPEDAIKGNDTPADVIVRGKASGFLQDITSGKHHSQADEPVTVGGTDAAPTPYDYLLAGLGACTSMTVGLYARRKKWPLDDVTVALRHSRIHAQDCADCETKEGMLDRIEIDVH